jgi:hypothetical protein
VALPAELATAVAAVQDRSVPSRALGDASRSVGLPQPVNLEILGYSTGTHIKRGEFVRIRVISAEGTFLSDAEADQTDPLLPYELRLQRRSPLTSMLAALPPNAPLAVHHSADHGATPWEAIVTSALAQAVPEGAEKPTRTIWRRMQKADRRPLVRSSEWTVLEAVGSAPWIWSPRIRVDRVTELPLSAVMPYRVVRLVGWASETRSGVGFALDRPGLKATGYPRTAAELEQITAGADLVIVQGLPDHEPYLADWSREQAAYMRQIGAEFALHGVPAVVIVPPCALYATRPLADMLAGEPEQLSAAGVVQAVEALRTLIRQGGPADRAVEDALNICLYLSDTLTKPQT